MTQNYLNIFFLVLGVELTVINSQMCTDPRRFGDVIQHGKERRGTEIKTIEKVGLVQCWKICVQYSLCTSINFMDSKCTLLTGNNLEIVSKSGSITSEKKDWSIERIAGNCYNHNCPSNSVCIEASKGFSCEIIRCIDPSAGYAEYNIFTFYTAWGVNLSAAIPCDKADRCTQLFTCQQNGLWSNVTYITEEKSPSCLNEGTWTQWFDRDNPGGSGDYEAIHNLVGEYPGKLCKNASSLDFRLTSEIDYKFGDDVLIISPSTGLRCLNKHQIDGKCENYKVRFCC